MSQNIKDRLLGFLLEVDSDFPVALSNKVNIYDYSKKLYEKADIISTFVFRLGLGSGNYSYATAVGMFEGLLNLILLSIANKASKKLSGSGLW